MITRERISICNIMITTEIISMHYHDYHGNGKHNISMHYHDTKTSNINALSGFEQK